MAHSREDEADLKKALLQIKEDPAVFSSLLLGVKPFSYQIDFLRDDSKRIVMCAGRRVGKSVMTGAKALWFALTNERVNVMIISATLRQSMMMFDTILDYVDSSVLITNNVTRQTRTLVRFSNGSKIKALPCGTGKGLRGDTSHMIIMDEAAFMPESVIAEVVLPMLATTDGTAIMLSTPYAKDHIFYKAFTNDKWSKYHFASSVNPMVKPEFLEEQKELIGEKRFRQEYLAEFTDDERAYFPRALIASCLHSCSKTKCEYCDLFSVPGTLGENAGNMALYGGYDPGGKGDPAAFVVVQKEKDGTQRVVLVKTYLAQAHGKKLEDSNLYTRFTQQIADLNSELKMKKMFMDQTGLGNPIIEHARALKLPVEGMNLSSKSKEELLSNLKILFEQKKIMLPSADRDLELSILGNLNCIEAEVKPAGGYAFSHPQGTHDDIAFALALACWGASGRTAAVQILQRDPEQVQAWRQGL